MIESGTINVNLDNDVVTLKTTFSTEQRKMVARKRIRARAIDMQFYKCSIVLLIFIIVLCENLDVTNGKCFLRNLFI